ncbi:MAG: sugar metabolism transcriptional regulator [Oscillatoriales cyanobacterium RM2_1_1]|nr:sugar metabolism transcriptional regulator [Oscillatoriales cyanobacterium SM2_3_0]NJO46974.1 sugar metabolism transcriptional regulator [Oscillatoriales cyanobacterium RM2_1_1]
MILQQLQSHLRQSSRASLEELAHRFQVDVDALRAMLKPLIRKGRIRKLASQQCGGCHSCAPESLELYEWIRPEP